jgi:predicted regulator of Ras-like GTPase activity (Roadblock/LC7/MglB family)
MMSEYDVVVEHIERQPGVLGAMLVGMDDGMVIARTDGLGDNWETAAALASSLFRKARKAADDAGLGAASFVRLEADRGHLCATARGEIVLVAVTNRKINLGKLRLEMLSSGEQV